MLNSSQPSLPTTYTSADLQGAWEFKIIQSSTFAFRKRQTLQKVQEEEAQAGWILLEKIDDGHLRFKRPVSARANDHNLPFDAYRVHYGSLVATRLISFWLVILIMAITLYFFFKNP